jgi:multidrug resistance protein, MATE family
MNLLKKGWQCFYAKIELPLERLILRKMRGRGGLGEVIKIAGPFVLSMFAITIMAFVDRMFLSWHSTAALAAVMPAMALTWLFSTIFFNTAAYVNTFVAQYYGAKKFDQIGKIVWQGVYFSIVAIIPLWLCIPIGKFLFTYFHGSTSFFEQEITYFSMLMRGSFFAVLLQVPLAFFAGLGKTRINMYAVFLQVGINIIFDYLLIFGNFGFPELGVAGAALSSVLAWFGACVFGFIFLFRKKYRIKYGIGRFYQFNLGLFWRLVRFGIPNGLGYFAGEIMFAFYTLIVGTLGVVMMAASNVLIAIYLFAILPIFGFGMATSILIGQYIGRGKKKVCDKVLFNVFFSTGVYCAIAIGLIFFFADQILGVFGGAGDTGFVLVSRIAYSLILTIPFVIAADILYHIYANALGGAGDTKFKMVVTFLFAFIVMGLEYAAVKFWHMQVLGIWLIATVYYLGAGILMYFRYQRGVWKKINIHKD